MLPGWQREIRWDTGKKLFSYLPITNFLDILLTSVPHPMLTFFFFSERASLLLLVTELG